MTLSFSFRQVFFIASIFVGGFFAGSAMAAPRAVFLIGEDEYKTAETLPEFARAELESRGWEVAVVTEDAKDKNQFPGLIEELKKADLLVLSVRRRFLPKEQLEAVRAYLDSGKPLVGIRTACHPFCPAPNTKVNLPAGSDTWMDFDPTVLGGHYTGHHKPNGEKVMVKKAEGADASPILANVDIAKLVGNGSLYKVSEIDKNCTPILIGSIPNQQAEPIAWTHSYGAKKGKVFYTSLGHPDDFKESDFRQLLLNGIYWASNQGKVPDKK